MIVEQIHAVFFTKMTDPYIVDSRKTTKLKRIATSKKGNQNANHQVRKKARKNRQQSRSS